MHATAEDDRAAANLLRRPPPGFSLIELMVVVAVISMLIALLLPAVQSAREAARRTLCANHLRQLGLAVHNYHDAHRITPMGNDIHPTALWGGWEFNAGTNVRLLPYMEQAPLFNRIDFDQSLYSTSNVFLLEAPLELVRCPSDTGEAQSGFDPGDLSPNYDPAFVVAYTNYVGCVGPRWWPGGTAFAPQPPKEHYRGLFSEYNSDIRFRDVTDGLSNTFLFGERARGVYPDDDRKWVGWWVSGWAGDSMFVTLHPINTGLRIKVLNTFYDRVRMFGCASSLHPGGAQFCMADGSVRFVSESLDSWDVGDAELQQLWDTNSMTSRPGLYQWLSTRNGNEAPGEF